MQPGDVQRTWADTRKASRLFGYDPAWDFRSGIREFVRWYRESRGAGRSAAEGEPAAQVIPFQLHTA